MQGLCAVDRSVQDAGQEWREREQHLKTEVADAVSTAGEKLSQAPQW